MSLKASLPGYRDPIIGQGGVASRPIWTFFQAIATTVDALSDASGNVTIPDLPISENANVVGASGFSIYTQGTLKTGIVRVLLQGDTQTPGNTQYYGSGPTGSRGWFSVSDALDSTANITLAVGADGITTLDLADLTNSGTGAALVKLTRDSKGRISGTSAATTDDLAEGSTNLWFTNERAQDAVGAALVGTGNVPLSYDDAGNAISAALSSGVLTSLSKADSAIQSIVAGTGVSVDATDPHNPVVSAPGAGATIPAGYIDGLRLQWVSGTALTVSSGAAYIEGSGAVLSAPTAIAKTGLSLTASTWYHVYLYDNAGTPAVEVVTTAPALPYNGTARSKTGDTSRRYIGSVRVGSGATLYNFEQVGSRILYREDIANGTLPFRVLANGTSTTDTVVSCASVVPPTASAATLRMQNNSTVGGFRAKQSDGTYSAAGAANQSISPGGLGIFDMALNSSQELIYFYSSTPSGGGGYIDVSGYAFER